MTDPIPIVCELSALDAAERELRARLAEKVRASVREIRELGDGFSLVLDAALVSEEDLRKLLELEGKCCRFLHLEYAGPRGDGSWVFKATGGEGVKEFLVAELT